MDRALNTLPRQSIPQVLVGFEGADDAGVYRLTDELALVQTVDFFSPIVDDAFTFGQIAAANALSDIYAMGGKPLTALAIVGFPSTTAEPEVLGDIMAGGLDKLNECGVALLGGHSVRDDEIKFGYAVTGTIAPGAIRDNGGAVPGDRILLTKPLGTGLIATALKKGDADPGHVDGAVAVMVETTRAAAEAVADSRVRTMTDITGFGLLGHGLEVARASDVTLDIDHTRIRVLEGALEYSARGYCAGGLKSNRDFFSPDVTFGDGVSEDYRNLLFDPQTSGGLLIFAPAAGADTLVTALRSAGVVAVEIGTTTASGPTRIVVA